MRLRAWAIIPVLDEAAAIGAAVAGIRDHVEGVIVVDGGSHDGTAEIARAARARVLVEPRRGYGLAVTCGIEAAHDAGAQAYVIFDGNGTALAVDVVRLLEPVAAGACDLSLGIRPAARLRALQRFGNRFAVTLMALALGHRYGDVSSVRAVSAQALETLALDDRGYGWPLELQARAAARKLRIRELPISLAPRQGRSKVSGTARGQAHASVAFLRVLWRECLRPGARA